ncbi:MAG: DUF5655 domain-containing protein [Patescibacteria group bacterium]|nr:DUF5655 domain-containing protein [Patescibacteria group bacterium]
MWQCPKCKREFARVNQSHSCVVFSLENHFRGKEQARKLFDFLITQIKNKIGPVKIESLPCCIHFVSSFSFGACWALKDRIRIDFRVDEKIKTKRSFKMKQISVNRYMYYFDIFDKKEINAEILGFIKTAYHLDQ